MSLLNLLSRKPRPENAGLRLVVGLGNPGDEYADTPHNMGFAVLDELARRTQLEFRRGPKPKMTSVKLAAEAAVLMKPLSFMNLSGQPVREALSWFTLEPADLIVVCDDANLPLGALRIRKGGGAGGQKGLKSVIEQLRTEEFARLRVGVGGGHPGADVGEHVLSKFRGARLKIARELTSTAADALESMLREGIDAAMNKYNSVS